MKKWLAVALLGMTFALVAPVSPAAAQDDDQDDVFTTAVWSYDVQPASGEINATVTFTLRADKPSQRISGGTRSFFWTGYSLFIDSRAENVVVTQEDTELEITERTVFDKDLDLIEFDFVRNVNFGQTATVTVTYDLIADDAGSTGNTRINPAFVMASIYPDPALDELTIQLRGVNDYDDRPSGFTETDTDEETGETFYVRSFEGLLGQKFDLDLRRLDGLTSTEAGTDAYPVTIEAWPGHTQWQDLVSTQADTTLPLIGELTGLDWPLPGPVVIRESVARPGDRSGGAAGASGVIELGDDAVASDVARAMAHVWFNDNLITEGWIYSGLAQEFAAQAVDPGSPRSPSAAIDDRDAFPLIDFMPGSPPAARDEWGTEASWMVVRAITDEIGVDGLGRVVQALDAGEIPYVGNGEAEILDAAPTWRTFLDLAEERGNSDDVDAILREWVLQDDPDSITELARRDSTRSAYARLEQKAGGWSMPLEIRTAMTEWRFDDADELIADAEAIIDNHNSTVELLAPFSIEPPTDVRDGYEAGDASLAETETLAGATLRSAELVASAHARADADPSFIDRIGLIGKDVDEPLGRLDAAFANGDFAQVETVDDEIGLLLDDASSNGTLYLGGAGFFGLLTFLLGGFALVRIRKKQTA